MEANTVRLEGWGRSLDERPILGLTPLLAQLLCQQNPIARVLGAEVSVEARDVASAFPPLPFS